jgi:4-amino-4-deoxy-L-arabinose transferase-like glycosyltransferase
MPPTGLLSRRRPAALLVFLATLGVLAFSVTSRRQLGPLGGMTDEWHPLAANLAVHGVLGMGEEPWILRPPGYPAFVALLLKAAGPPPVSTWAWRAQARPLVYAAQAVVMAAAAALLFAWLSGWLRPVLALEAALVFGLSPLTVAWVGMLHYTVLHLLGIVAAMWALQRAFLEPGRTRRMLLTGALVGLVTLVRPVTLVLPAFALLALLVRARGAWRPALRATALLSLGMAVVILPWTARNYAVSGRLVPVNLQAGVVAWAATEKALPWDPDHYLWFEVGPELLRIHTRVTGRPDYDIVTFVAHLPELEAEYRREALRNLRQKPWVYAGNVARVLWAFAAQTSTALPRAFVRLQGDPSPAGARPSWFRRGSGDDPGSPGLALALRVVFGAATLLAAAGLLLGLRARDPALLGPLALLACLAVAHAITHLDLLHHYLRLPFVVVLSFYALDRVGGRAEAPARAAGLALAAASLALTTWVLLSRT